jgi:hypothetical protein
MPATATILGGGAIAAYMTKDGLAKLLGPTADYLGGELKAYTEKRIQNVGKIFNNAERKLGDKLEQPGSVPPKVLKTIINEGSYSEDEIAVEYFSGVLASSRTENSRDDRGARIAKILDNMSSYQLRFHYLFYSTIASVFKHKNLSFNELKDRTNLELFMPLEGFYVGMGFSEEEWNNPQLMLHIFSGLESDGMIDKAWKYGPRHEYMDNNNDRKVLGSGVVCTPSVSGAELFLWGFGKGNNDLSDIFFDDFSTPCEGLPDIVEGALATLLE